MIFGESSNSLCGIQVLSVLVGGIPFPGPSHKFVNDLLVERREA